MNPNALLDDLRDLVIKAFNSGESATQLEFDFARAFNAMDNWLSMAGTRPQHWL